TAHHRSGTTSLIAAYPSSCITNFSGALRINHLAKHHCAQSTDGVALQSRNRVNYPRHDQFAAVGNRCHCDRHLQRRDPDLVPHGNTCDGDFAPGLRWPNETVDLAWQLNSCALAKSEASNVLVEFLFAHSEREFGRSDVARFDENFAHAEVRKRAMVVQRCTAELPEAVLTKDARIRPQLAF